MRYLKAKVPRILISVHLMSPVVRSGCECSKSLALPGVGKKKKKQPLQSARQTMSVDTERGAQTVGEGSVLAQWHTQVASQGGRYPQLHRDKIFTGSAAVRQP